MLAILEKCRNCGDEFSLFTSFLHNKSVEFSVRDDLANDASDYQLVTENSFEDMLCICVTKQPASQPAEQHNITQPADTIDHHNEYTYRVFDQEFPPTTTKSPQ